MLLEQFDFCIKSMKIDKFDCKLILELFYGIQKSTITNIRLLLIIYTFE